MTGENLQIRGTDALIAIGLGLDWTQEQTAEFAGCTDRTVRNRKDIEAVQWLSSKISTAVARDQKIFVEKTREEMESEFKKRFDDSLRALDDSLKSEDIKDKQWAADRVWDRSLGKATQRQEIAGQIENRHIYELPSDVSRVFVEAVREMKGLPAPPEAIEAEVVSDGDSGS